MLHLGTPVRIGLCADTHFWFNGPNQVNKEGRIQPQQQSEQIQETLLQELDKAHLDMIFHLGDMTCGGGSYDMPHRLFEAMLTHMHQRFHQLTPNFHALPGNHDCPPGGGDWSFFEQLYGLESRLGTTIDLPHARLVLLNAQGHSLEQIEAGKTLGDPITGWVNKAELARLEDALMTAGDRPVLLFVHQLLHPWSNEREWNSLYGVDNADEVLAIMAQYENVRAVFQSHAHLFDLQSVQLGTQPCQFVVTPSVIEYPMGWLLLEVSTESLSIEMQRLPLPELAEMSRKSGEGQTWRAGEAAWQEIEFSLK